jgi:hypothetical protein
MQFAAMKTDAAISEVMMMERNGNLFFFIAHLIYGHKDRNALSSVPTVNKEDTVIFSP